MVYLCYSCVYMKSWAAMQINCGNVKIKSSLISSLLQFVSRGETLTVWSAAVQRLNGWNRNYRCSLWGGEQRGAHLVLRSDCHYYTRVLTGCEWNRVKMFTSTKLIYSRLSLLFNRRLIRKHQPLVAETWPDLVLSTSSSPGKEPGRCLWSVVVWQWLLAV